MNTHQLKRISNEIESANTFQKRARFHVILTEDIRHVSVRVMRDLKSIECMMDLQCKLNTLMAEDMKPGEMRNVVFSKTAAVITCPANGVVKVDRVIPERDL